MSHHYSIYGGITEEEFVDVQDQDFEGEHYMDRMPPGAEGVGPFGTVDVQYAKQPAEEHAEHEVVEIGQPEEVYYDGDDGFNPEQAHAEIQIPVTGDEQHLVEAVEQMNLQVQQQLESEQNGHAENVETVPVAVEQVQVQNGEVLAVPDAVVEEQAGEDPPTPTATVAPTSLPNPNARPLSEVMAAETQYPIPYRSKLTEPFEPGQTLIVRGKTAEDSVRFTINLHHASADFSGNDVPLHISVRFDEGKMVFNTFSKGEWGKEERKSNPYKKGDDIDIRIRAHDSKFTIYADQKEVKEYEHRVPLSSVSHFSIDGDILVTHIHWGGKYYPVPYESGITGDGFNPGKTMLIFGTPEKKGKRFHINLLKKNGDIALHFNPRFDEKAIVRNSLIANEWGNEEREGKIPLEKGIGFDLKIVNEEYAFQIFLNDERFCSYAHRMEPHDIHGLQIGGDVEITGIQIF